MGWHPYTHKDLIECNMIFPRILSNVKKNDKVIDVPPGYREDSGRDVCYVEDIDPKFHQGNEVTCAWSVTSILIDLLCSDTADKMVQLRDRDPEEFSHIHLFKGGKHGSVASLLQKYTDYELKKVTNIGRFKDRVDNIMKRDKGLFLCVLADLNASQNHCIGIDCKSHLIYDAVDLKVKKLTKENIEYCTGLYENGVSAGFAGFANVAEIVKKRGK